MIPPVSSGALPRHDIADPHAPLPSGLDALLAQPSLLAFHAGPNGGGGGGGATAKADRLAGTALPGQPGVKVDHTVGDPGGYASRNHAIAWARAADSDRAMVVQVGNRWYAVVTDKPGCTVEGTQGTVTSALQLGRVDPAEYKRLHEAALKDRTVENWQALAAYALGVPKDQINVVTGDAKPSSTKINVNLSPTFDAEGRAAGMKEPPWVQLGPSAFDRPANVFATLAHEEVHASHREMALELFAKFEKAHTRDSFRVWLAKNEKDVRKADIAAGVHDGALAATELEAHIEAAKLAFASGDETQARTDLGKVGRRPVLPLPQTQEHAKDELRALRDSLSGSARKVFDEVVRESNRNGVLKKL